MKQILVLYCSEFIDLSRVSNVIEFSRMKNYVQLRMHNFAHLGLIREIFMFCNYAINLQNFKKIINV